jgi:hypothetical protein
MGYNPSKKLVIYLDKHGVIGYDDMPYLVAYSK